jgi:hypothetical protein
MKSVVFWDMTPCSPLCSLLVGLLDFSSTLKMEALCSSETSVATQQTTRHHIPEDYTLHNHHCENLKSYIVFLYGEATHRQVRRFEKLRIKKTRPLCTLSFLLRCRGQSTIPHFLQFHHHIRSEAARRIYRRTSFCLLRERIHHTRRELDAVSTELMGLQQRLARYLSGGDWDLIDRITTEKVSRLAEEGKAKHCNKFQRLHRTQHPPLSPDNKKTIINLSKIPLEEAACSALSKGLNYAVTPAVLPIEDILCGVEKAVGALPEETAEEV